MKGVKWYCKVRRRCLGGCRYEGYEGFDCHGNYIEKVGYGKKGKKKILTKIPVNSNKICGV